ncbi:MAG: DnaJ domain-containing protein, partial [Kofleriaceae bacterium]
QNGHTSPPAISRTATPPMVDQGRARPTAHPAFDGPRVATPTNHPAFDRPVTARTETPTGPFDRRTPSSTVPPRNLPPTISRTATPTSTPVMGRTASTSLPGRTPTNPVVGRAPSPQEPAVGRAPSPTGPVAARTMTPLRPQPPGGPTISRTTSQSRATAPAAPLPLSPSSARASRGSGSIPVRSRTNTAATLETETLIRDRHALIERGADHFVLLGIATDATADLVRAAYFTLARKLHPDRLASLGIVDAQRDAQRVMAQINAAFAVLNDNLKRVEYLQILDRGGESVVNAEEQKANETAMRVMTAEEAFRRGEMALRREQLDQAIAEVATAVELQPQEAEYGALLAWARFAAAGDKQAIARETRLALQRAADRLMQSPTARFYLGRVERILGREREALEHFYEVLRIKPNHADASSEIRVLETRLKKR